MTECPVCLEQLPSADVEALACHMILRHGTEFLTQPLAPLGCEYVPGYVFCFCGHLMNVGYEWPSGDALAEASDCLAGHWESKGGLAPHLFAYLLGVEDGAEEGTV